MSFVTNLPEQEVRTDTKDRWSSWTRNAEYGDQTWETEIQTENVITGERK